jgi:two-component system OmpR family sensor kinase
VIGLAGSLEQRVLRRTRLVVAVQLAAAIGLVVLLVSAIAYVVSAHQQNGATERYVGIALGQDRGGIKYSCLWLFTMPASRRPGASITTERAEGASVAPPGFPVMASMRSVAAGGAPVEETVAGDRTIYLVRTVRAGDQVRQAVFDLAYQRDNSRQLLIALMVAGLVGLAWAGALGLLLSRRAVRPLEEALDRQQRFVADASHELRAPLTRLHTRAQMLLLKESDLPAPVATELRKMVRGTHELAEVVDDLLRSARLRAGADVAEHVDLAALVNDLIAAEAGRLTDLRLTAELHADPGRPTVAGVESSLRRMLSALMDNAIAHSHPGGRIRVSIAIVDQGSTVELVVADEGVGVDPARQRTIFERFVRGATSEGARHGLGLALAREVVDSHHGTISVGGEPGRGARFIVRIPVAERDAAAVGEPGGASSPAVPGRPRRYAWTVLAHRRHRARTGR